MATEVGTGYLSLVPETSSFARESGRAFDRAADDMQRRFARAFDGTADDMRRTFSRASDQAFSGLANDIRPSLNRAFDQSADDMRRTFNRATDQVGRDMQQTIGRAGQGAGQEGGQAAAGGIADALKGKAGMIGEVLGAVFAVAGVSVGGLFMKALQQGFEREQSLDLAQARLGVDDATMQRIGTAAGRAYAGAFGSSVEENIDTARRAIQSGLLDPNATAQETQQVISQLSGISDLMGEEIPAVSRAAGQAIRTGIAGSATEAFDLFAAAERNGLNVSEDFLDTITEYGTQFRKLGLTGPEAVGLVNQAVKAGARDTDIAADAMKEFSIRVVDGSESTADAFQKLGVPVEKTMGMFLNGGAEARDAMTQLFVALSKVDDPVKANGISLALFGTQLEDLGDAFHNFNLDTAADSLGKVAGSAQNAMNAVGGNAATSIESAKRSIQTSTDAISSALAKAFGPELAKVADWVTKHQPEVLGFFGKLADGVFAAADVFLVFSSTSLRALAAFADGAGNALGSVLDPIGGIAEVFGKLTHDSALEDLGSDLQGMSDKFRGAADTARAMADGIDNTVRPGLDRMRDSVVSNIETTQRAQEVFRALGDTVTALPSGHDIVLKDNTPEVTQRLEALGLKVTTLPNGEVRVTANTAAGQAKLDAFIQQNSGKVLPVEIAASLSAESRRIAEAAQNSGSQTYSQGYVRYADGGLFRGKGGPRDDANLAMISNGEYITQAASVGPGTLPLLEAINNGWVPPAGLLHSMIPGYATGGLASSRATSWAQAQNGKPYIYGPQDCSWYQSGIYNQLTGKNVRFTTASDLTAFGFKPGSDPTGFTIGTNGGQYGGQADGPESMPKQYYLPRDLWAPPETDNPALQSAPGALQSGGGGTGGGAGGLGGGTGGSAGGAAGAGASFGGVQIPSGVTPVWIVGSNITGSSAPSGDSATTAAPSESFAPQASTQPAQMPDMGARALQAGGNFLSANVDQFLGDLGLRREGGAIQALVSAIYDAMARAVTAEMQKANSGQNRGLLRYAGRPY